MVIISEKNLKYLIIKCYLNRKFQEKLKISYSFLFCIYVFSFLFFNCPFDLVLDH